MRRKEREITDIEHIEEVIRRAEVCHLGLVDGDVPYVIPLNFGYRKKCLYFHCAQEGKKIDILRKNNNVCFQVDVDHRVILSDGKACTCTAKYKSVIGFGTAYFVENEEEKIEALNILMEHYTGIPIYDYNLNQVKGVAIIKVEITQMAGKQSGY